MLNLCFHELHCLVPSCPNCQYIQVNLSDLKSDTATLIVFMCNHCPYVIHVLNQLVKIFNEYKQNIDN